MKLWNKNKYSNKTDSESWENLANFLGLRIEDIDRNNLKSATYYACMLVRCNALAKLTMRVMRYTEKEGAVEVPDHPLSILLKTRPNPFTNVHDFMWATKFQELEHGNAFWVMDTDGRGRPKALYLLDSTKVEIMIDDIGLLRDRTDIYYTYDDPKYGQKIYTSDNIIHFKNFPTNSIEGKSVKKYLSDVIDSEKYSSKMLKGRYKTGLQDPIVVQYAGDLSDEKQRKVKNKFADMGGAKNAGKVLVIQPDFKVSQLETKLVNNQFFQLQGLTTKQIANAFGVKSFQLNDLSSATFNNVEKQNQAFYSDTLQNDVTTHEQEMSYKMLRQRERGEGLYINFNVDSILRSNITERFGAYTQSIGAGIMTRAEVRKKENLPYIEGTDELTLNNGAAIPLKDLGKQYDKNTEGGENNVQDTTMQAEEPGNK